MDIVRDWPRNDVPANHRRSLYANLGSLAMERSSTSFIRIEYRAQRDREETRKAKCEIHPHLFLPPLHRMSRRINATIIQKDDPCTVIVYTSPVDILLDFRRSMSSTCVLLPPSTVLPYNPLDVVVHTSYTITPTESKGSTR